MVATRNGKKTVLAVGSHPDDIEFGCGGTLNRFAGSGNRVYMLVLTAGDRGGTSAVRQREQRRSCEILGVQDIFWTSFEDTRLPFCENVIPEIEQVVKKLKPDYVFVHHGKDTHQDHRHVSASTVVATRNIPNVLFYEGPTTIDFTPSIYVDVAEYMKVKVKSLSCHRSQVMRTNIDERSIVEIAKATATFRGTQCRIPYAEAFASLRMFIVP